MDDLVAIAKIVKPRGLRGEVAADLLTDFCVKLDVENKVIWVSAPEGLLDF
ncbi:MAG: hypothetical protein LC734_05800 [Acidobacteria bacterium]|nr:hypothetical protein [Acidobacteriota bacterium]